MKKMDISSEPKTVYESFKALNITPIFEMPNL